MTNSKFTFKENWNDLRCRELLECMLFTFIFGLWAHTFGITNLNLNHDGLTEFYFPNDAKWQISLGRYLTPLFHSVTATSMELPWTVGIMCLTEIGLSVFLICRLLEINDRTDIALIAGLFSTNITVTAMLATYPCGAPADFFALLCISAAVYCWHLMLKSRKIIYGLGGAFLIFVSLGLYQAYIPCYIVLVVLILVKEMIKGEKALNTIKNGAAAALILLAGGIIYWIGLQISKAVTGIELVSGETNSLSNIINNTDPITHRIFLCFKQVFKTIFLNSTMAYSSTVILCLNCILWGGCLICLWIVIRQKKIKLTEKIVLVLLIAALIPASNALKLFTTLIHTLMIYGIWMLYLLPIVLFKDCRDRSPELGKWLRKIEVAIVCILIYCNVQTANMVYVKKEIENEATLSVMTDVMGKIETMDSYVEGETPVYFMGLPGHALEKITGTESIEKIMGVGGQSPITYYPCYKEYISNMLLRNPNIITKDDDRLKDIPSEQLQEIPLYPSNGSVTMIDGVAIVKFSDKT